MTDCQKNREKVFVLQPGCPYSRKEFENGLIAMERDKLALFYLPLPLDIPEEFSLRALFRYDMF